MADQVLFGYRHVSGIPLCPCRDPGNYVACDSDTTNPLAFTLRCWCGSSMKGAWDDEADKLAFLQANDGLTDDQRARFIAAAERGLAHNREES